MGAVPIRGDVCSPGHPMTFEWMLILAMLGLFAVGIVAPMIVQFFTGGAQ